MIYYVYMYIDWVSILALEQLAGHMQSMLPEINRLCAEMGRPVVYAATGDATLTALAVQARLSPVSSEGSEADGFMMGFIGFPMVSRWIFQEDGLLGQKANQN